MKYSWSLKSFDNPSISTSNNSCCKSFRNIRQNFIEWLYDDSDKLQDELAKNINEMHKQIVTEDLIKREINK